MKIKQATLLKYSSSITIIAYPQAINITGRYIKQDFLHLSDHRSLFIHLDPLTRRKGVTEDEVVGWHHRLNGHEFEQALRDSEGQGSLACCSPWGCKDSDATEWLNSN